MCCELENFSFYIWYFSALEVICFLIIVSIFVMFMFSFKFLDIYCCFQVLVCSFSHVVVPGSLLPALSPYYGLRSL